ncbi:transcription repressor NadR [Fusibacter tunisiensis]|uniref:Transcriptional regulator of NAD metabolism n=1 Tax=Fusibacter tunisiensis TaxID=1008308 RepID=A0ABS2MUC7_9FIRM|nr:transcription repressor NadR [Fusibacter tunisiensis]MBM7563018.1 transcriptional regulator of NAD metabolism [Fusibacter tunisiensis]
MVSEERRQKILAVLNANEKPITGTELADLFSVSRQVIVQDIAIIRASGVSILATSNGYMTPKNVSSKKLIKTFVSQHKGIERLREELLIIVEYGGKIIDVIVEHPIYGEIVGSLHISTVEDVEQFVEKVQNVGASPLSVLTQGAHIHTIEVPSEKLFNLILTELKAKGFIL